MDIDFCAVFDESDGIVIICEYNGAVLSNFNIIRNEFIGVRIIKQI